MTDEELKRTRAESRALLARRHEQKQEPEPAPQPEPMPNVISLSDQLRREQRDADRDWYEQRDAERETELRRRRAIERRAAAPTPAPDWSAVDERFRQAIEAERRFILDVVAEAMRGLLQNELGPIEARLTKLETMLNRLRERSASERTKVIDMPSPLSSRARTVN
jgi:hypothetical protein